MTNGQRNITTLLAVIAVLLGLNMLVRGSPSVEAQMTGGPTEPTAVSIAAMNFPTNPDNWRVFRLWSDGSVDGSFVDFTSGTSAPALFSALGSPG